MNNNRRTGAWDKRQAANQLATDRPHPKHYSNEDELKFRHKENTNIAECHKNHSKEMNRSYEKEISIPNVEGKPSFLMSFTKGMPHNYETGLLNNPVHFQYFLRAIDSGDPRDFRDTPLGPEEAVGNLKHCVIKKNDAWKSTKARDAEAKLRAWESQSAGLAFELEGPDAQAVTMPPAPILGSDELTAEMAEVYVQALARDIPLNALTVGVIEKQYLDDFCGKIPKNGVANKPQLDKLHAEKKSVEDFLNLTEKLKHLPWFSKEPLKKLSDRAETRRCDRQCPQPSTAFRGITKGDDVGPYLSQFLLMGNSGINGNDNERKPEDGYISYGAISIDQRVRFAKPNENHMTNWEEWFDVQNAANLGGLESFENNPQRRFIYTGRDLATYVHYDALYEAYLNACLILLGNGVKFDPGIPFQEDDNRDHQQGFAHFGGPHILSLVTEVATRALKAVRYQKYNIHRRCRPEVLAARITKSEVLKDMAPELLKVKNDLGKGPNSILDMINTHNGPLHEGEQASVEHPNYLLPMAFCEGSPMHPAYGAGHATVAGACITILKAFFDCNSLFTPDGDNSDKAFVAVDNGKSLKLVPVLDRKGHKAHLTVEGELNKLASNISIGRNWAGVHYFTDYYESLLMGEQIAIGILEEQKLMFGENFSMTIPLFGGSSIRI